MPALTVQSQVDEVVNKYNNLSLNKEANGPTTIEVQLKQSYGFKPGYGDAFTEALPQATKNRFEKYGIDISKGYPRKAQEFPYFLDDAYKATARQPGAESFVERGTLADPSKKKLFAKAKEVRNLTKYIGTELVGVQLADLDETELNELGLLISERVVVFLRNQELSPQKQLEIGSYLGHEVEKHPVAAHVPLPGVEGPTGITTIWGRYNRRARGAASQGFKRKGGKIFHTDLDHIEGLSYGHLHLDAIPNGGSGDTVWTSGYGAYDKLSPDFQKFLDGKTAVHKSAHTYYDRDDPLSGPKFVEREFPLVVTHPVTGWKSLFVNRSHTVRIPELEPEESKLVLEYLYSVLEENLDIQVRFTWADPSQDRSLGASAIWDNRVANHYAVADYDDVEDERHGTRVTSLGVPASFDPNSKSQREALGLSN
ncbi:hypothetical protein WICMUC_003804 [Wickerhamomyces mucosus]|uniref:TauD/TfdA-like domain-containing protein n=1 Tax=Wickerhamomyces mucosus TaxID=1378264 RepID=A0A9P8TBN6_9ASCO|nr:hypothetical protein WICMUC_003804 [Wickerhamomyces mucosus]